MASVEIKLPSDVTLADNGQMRDELLVPCGVFSSFFPHGELKMHHLHAARAMRAMVAEATIKVAALGQVRAADSYRKLDQQIRAFDGTDPGKRTQFNGRYIPEELWHTFGSGQLLPKIKNWKGKKWKRRKGTDETAKPGESNHGWGLAVDFDQGQLPKWLGWLQENAHRFGFVDEVDSEDWHWSYRLGDQAPPALAGSPRRGIRGQEITTTEEDDMRVIDLAPNTPAFTRLVISGRVKWVRGHAATALDKMKVTKLEVQRNELMDLIRTFGTEGLSPFNSASRSSAPDAELDDVWEKARL